MRVPTVHRNGTSREELLSQARRAARAVANAIVLVSHAAPNGRDFYIQGQDAIQEAQNEHHHRIHLLKSVQGELEALWTAIDEQGA